MKFYITRTSMWSDEKPCKEAVREKYVWVDERCASAPEDIPAFKDRPTDWWYGEGNNHRVENGCIKRDMEAEGWFIEISGLKELIDFIGKEGEVIVSFSENHISGYPIIEIYDDYRE